MKGCRHCGGPLTFSDGLYDHRPDCPTLREGYYRVDGDGTMYAGDEKVGRLAKPSEEAMAWARERIREWQEQNQETDG